MKYLAAALALVILAAGCTGQSFGVDSLVKQTPAVKNFLADYPNAKLTTNLLNNQTVAAQLDKIRKDCDNEDFQVSSYYKTVLTDSDSNTKLTLWTDSTTFEVVCVIKEGLGTKSTLPPATLLKSDGNDCSSNPECISGYCLNKICSTPGAIPTTTLATTTTTTSTTTVPTTTIGTTTTANTTTTVNATVNTATTIFNATTTSAGQTTTTSQGQTTTTATTTTQATTTTAMSCPTTTTTQSSSTTLSHGYYYGDLAIDSSHIWIEPNCQGCGNSVKVIAGVKNLGTDSAGGSINSYLTGASCPSNPQAIEFGNLAAASQHPDIDFEDKTRYVNNGWVFNYNSLPDGLYTVQITIIGSSDPAMGSPDVDSSNNIVTKTFRIPCVSGSC